MRMIGVVLLMLVGAYALAADIHREEIKQQAEFVFTQDEIKFCDYLNTIRSRKVVLCPKLTQDCREWAEKGSPYHPKSGYYRYTKNGGICENIWGGSDPISVLNAMRRSSGHNANLMNTRVTRIGIGRGKDSTINRWAYRGGAGPTPE